MIPDRLIQRDRPIKTIALPFEYFARMEGSGGILLVIAAVIALVWANSAFSASYFRLWEIEISVWWGEYSLAATLRHGWTLLRFGAGPSFPVESAA